MRKLRKLTAKQCRGLYLVWIGLRADGIEIGGPNRVHRRTLASLERRGLIYRGARSYGLTGYGRRIVNLMVRRHHDRYSQNDSLTVPYSLYDAMTDDRWASYITKEVSPYA